MPGEEGAGGVGEEPRERGLSQGEGPGGRGLCIHILFQRCKGPSNPASYI